MLLDTPPTRQRIMETVVRLWEEGIVAVSVREDGEFIWSLTEAGRRAAKRQEQSTRMLDIE